MRGARHPTNQNQVIASFDLLPVDVAFGVILVWLALGLVGFALRNRAEIVTRFVFPSTAAIALLLALAMFVGLSGSPSVAVLPLGLPDLPFHLRVDALSAFFL